MPTVRRAVILLATACVLATVLAASAHATAPGLNFARGSGDTTQQELDAISDLRSRWVRLFVGWNDVEPLAKGARDELLVLPHFDRAIEAINARGAKVLLVVTGAPNWAHPGRIGASHPPDKVSDYADIMRFLAARYRSAPRKVSAFEVWNEPNEGEFWHGGPDAAGYARLLKAAYPAVKQVNPEATVLVGGLVGNDVDFVEKLYDENASDFFDAVGVHTDTACNLVSPKTYYRDEKGRVGRFSFTGYREIRAEMLERGDDKPIWLTEIGWSVYNGRCDVGALANTKAGGVSPADQAKYLSEAYRCIAGDPFVTVALWFSARDFGPEARSPYRFGLLDWLLGRRPAYDAMRTAGHAGAQPDPSCGGVADRTAPSVSVLSPSENATIFPGSLNIEAKASDDLELRRIEFWANGRKLRNFDRARSAELDWQGAKQLPYGTHTIEVKAVDAALNVTSQQVKVNKVDPATLPPVRTRATFRLRNGGGRVHLVSGAIRAAQPNGPQLTGKVTFVFQWRARRGWFGAQRYSRDANRSFNFPVRLKRAGRWRARAEYRGVRPFRSTRSRWINLTAR